MYYSFPEQKGPPWSPLDLHQGRNVCISSSFNRAKPTSAEIVPLHNIAVHFHGVGT